MPQGDKHAVGTNYAGSEKPFAAFKMLLQVIN